MELNTQIRSILIILFAIIAVSCGRNKREMLVGTWQGILLENAKDDSFYVMSQRVIDTMGKGHSNNENRAIYGVTNMDSVRQDFQVKHDSAQFIQKDRVRKTVFQFINNSMAYLTFAGNPNTDTTKWNFDDEGAIIFEDLSVGGGHAMKRMQIITLTDSILKLKLWTEIDTSQITFRRLP